jgi:hypothetical protein
LKDTELTESTCVDPGYSADRDETVSGKPLSFRRHSDRSEADLVLMMDVIEHVENDIGLVEEYAEKSDQEPTSLSQFLLLCGSGAVTTHFWSTIAGTLCPPLSAPCVRAGSSGAAIFMVVCYL